MRIISHDRATRNNASRWALELAKKNLGHALENHDFDMADRWRAHLRRARIELAKMRQPSTSPVPRRGTPRRTPARPRTPRRRTRLTTTARPLDTPAPTSGGKAVRS